MRLHSWGVSSNDRIQNQFQVRCVLKHNFQKWRKFCHWIHILSVIPQYMHFFVKYHSYLFFSWKATVFIKQQIQKWCLKNFTSFQVLWVFKAFFFTPIPFLCLTYIDHCCFLFHFPTFCQFSLNFHCPCCTA